MVSSMHVAFEGIRFSCVIYRCVCVCVCVWRGGLCVCARMWPQLRVLCMCRVCVPVCVYMCHLPPRRRKLEISVRLAF